MAARTPEDFYAATRAIDRILLWNFYYVPGLGSPGYRLVYWDKFGKPEHDLRLLRFAKLVRMELDQPRVDVRVLQVREKLFFQLANGFEWIAVRERIDSARTLARPDTGPGLY